MDYNLRLMKAELIDENTGLLKTSMWRIGKELEKELGAKIDELGSLDLEFEQKEAWSPEAGHWTGQLRWQM